MSPNEDQEYIPDTSEHVDEEDEEEISVVQRIGETTLCSIFNLKVKSSTPRSKLMGSFTLKHISGLSNVQNVDIVLLGDTVIVKITGALRIAVIKEIIRGKSKLKRATPEELAHLSLSLKEVKTTTPQISSKDSFGETRLAKS